MCAIVYTVLCPDGNQSDAARTPAALEISGNDKPSFTKTTVVLQSRTVLPTFPRTPPPSTFVIGMPRFDQKLDELMAERQAARCAAEAMANLSVLPVSAMSFPPTVPSTVDSLQSVAMASTVETEHRGSPLITSLTTSAPVPAEVEPCDVTDTSSASHIDKYSSYDRHFKKKFFGSERRPQSSEPVTKVADTDHPAGDGGRDGSTSSPDVANSVVCKKARLAEPNRNTVSPLCPTVQTPSPLVTGVLPPTSAVSTVSHESHPRPNPLHGEDELRGSQSCTPATTTASSFAAAAARSLVGASTGETSAQLSAAEPSLAVTQSISDIVSSQPAGCLSEQTTNEQVPPAAKTSLP